MYTCLLPTSSARLDSLLLRYLGYTAIRKKTASEDHSARESLVDTLWRVLGAVTNLSPEDSQALVFCDNPRSGLVMPELPQGRSP